jgi:predicted GIY-YIG superfamily endonuclease
MGSLSGTLYIGMTGNLRNRAFDHTLLSMTVPKKIKSD